MPVVSVCGHILSETIIALPVSNPDSGIYMLFNGDSAWPITASTSTSLTKPFNAARLQLQGYWLDSGTRDHLRVRPTLILS